MIRAKSCVFCWDAASFFLGALCAFQKPFPPASGVEYFPASSSRRTGSTGEWAFARLMFPPGPNDGYAGRFDAISARACRSGPRIIRVPTAIFRQAVRRLTRIQVRSVEQPVMMEDGDEAFNWPWIYAVQVGEWGFTEQEAKAMREYLLRGGFFMADDFSRRLRVGDVLEADSLRVFRTAPSWTFRIATRFFHTGLRPETIAFRFPAPRHLYQVAKNCGEGGHGAHWRGIYDDKGRIMVAISYKFRQSATPGELCRRSELSREGFQDWRFASAWITWSTP